MRSSATLRKIITLKRPASRTAADIEYRVAWNEIGGDWEIFRNGEKTGRSRRKKQSAIDMAILAIRSEEKSSAAKVIVTSLKDGSFKIEWAGRAEL
jgi:hypothetical protein